MSYNRFGRGGVYTCVSCGKRTRDTNGVACDLCASCYKEVSMENAHNDGHHDGSPNPDCPYCKAE